MVELADLGVGEAARAIRAGEISAESLCEALIARTERHASLNAFSAFEADAVRRMARDADRDRAKGGTLGPLHGVPLCLKDNIDTAALPTTACTPALRNHRPGADAPVAAALFAAGGILFGKNVMHELAFGITSNNAAFGAARNPYDPDLIPGGSSGGTAAAIAARLSPGGIGTDTGGSVRVPAALCGIAGLRPTLGRWSQEGIVPIASARDTAGPMARNVTDLCLLDTVVTGDREPLSPATLSGLRLGLPPTRFWEDLDDETARVSAAAIDALRQAGATIVEADCPDVTALNDAVSFVVVLYEVEGHIREYLARSGARVTFDEIVAQAASPDVKAVLAAITSPEGRVPETAYREAIGRHRPALIRAYEAYLVRNGLDAVVFPTTPLPARPIGEDETVVLGAKRVPTFPTYIRNTDPGSNAGFPGVTLPVGVTAAGLPVGLGFDGLPGADRRLLSIAAALEGVLPPMPGPRIDR